MNTDNLVNCPHCLKTLDINTLEMQIEGWSEKEEEVKCLYCLKIFHIDCFNNGWQPTNEFDWKTFIKNRPHIAERLEGTTLKKGIVRLYLEAIIRQETVWETKVNQAELQFAMQIWNEEKPCKT